jgi:hypothetical protein
LRGGIPLQSPPTLVPMKRNWPSRNGLCGRAAHRAILGVLEPLAGRLAPFAAPVRAGTMGPVARGRSV